MAPGLFEGVDPHALAAREGTPLYVYSAAAIRARDLGRSMNGYKVVVNKSTVPVGTAAKVRETIAAETKQPFSVVSNPEFLKQGAAVDDFMKPDRVVIGAEDERGAELMETLYKPFTRTGAPIMIMDCASAELSSSATASGGRPGAVTFADPRRFWDFRSLGHGDVNFEEIIVALNDIGYAGPLSVEWEDSRMDREFGAAEACAMVKRISFKPSAIAFDAQFDR